MKVSTQIWLLWFVTGILFTFIPTFLYVEVLELPLILTLLFQSALQLSCFGIGWRLEKVYEGVY